MIPEGARCIHTIRTTAGLIVVCDIIRRRCNLKDRPIKIAIVVVVDEDPVGRAIPHIRAIMNVATYTAVARDSVDLVEERVRRDQNAIPTEETNLYVQVVIHHVHAVA